MRGKGWPLLKNLRSIPAYRLGDFNYDRKSSEDHTYCAEILFRPKVEGKRFTW